MRLMNTTAVIDYVLKAERDKDGNPVADATVFKLRCLTSTEAGAVTDAMVDFGSMRVQAPAEGEAPKVTGMNISMSDRTKNRVRLGVAGYENLHNADGQPVEFYQEVFLIGARQFKGMPVEVFDSLPESVINELHNAIMDLSTLKAAEGN